MSFRTFCDECQKEIKDQDNFYRLDNHGKDWGILFFCPKCFKKHWQGTLPNTKH